ncbi:MAG: hypothetical protein JRL30_24355 [Deltaproteobacteria bacterium]|nr:hypothetical protein [Deltaproteobacteria bacterium]
MHIFKGYYPNVYQEMKKVGYVVGKVEGPLHIEGDEKVIFAGDCTSWEGDMDGEHVKIESSYKTPGEVDERKTKSNDMLIRNLKPGLNLFKNRNSRYIHIKGCPVSVADHVHYISGLGKIGNPNFDSRLFLDARIAYWQMRFGRFMNRFA